MVDFIPLEIRLPKKLYLLRRGRERRGSPTNAKSLLLKYFTLGTESSEYFSEEKYSVRRSVKIVVDRMISEGKGKDVIEIIQNVSATGLTCRKTSPIYILAICARSRDPCTKAAAYQAFLDICRHPTDMMAFVKFCEELSNGTGWGRAHRRAICMWYNSFENNPMELAENVTNFPKYEDWSHKDILRLSHIKPASLEVLLIVRYLVKGLVEAKRLPSPVDKDQSKVWNDIIKYLEAVELASHCSEKSEMIDLISKYNLKLQHVQVRLLNSASVWQALVRNMPLATAIQNIERLKMEETLEKRLTDSHELQASDIHPFDILAQINKESLTDSTRKALYKAFTVCAGSIQPTNLNYCIALHISDNMDTKMKEDASVKEIMAAMVLTIVKTESESKVKVFAYSIYGQSAINIAQANTLSKLQDKISSGATRAFDCCKPIEDALENSQMYDVFIVFTSSPTPEKKNINYVLHQYMEETGKKDVQVIMVIIAKEVEIDGFNDAFKVSVNGYDTNAMRVIRNFVAAHDPCLA